MQDYYWKNEWHIHITGQYNPQMQNEMEELQQLLNDTHMQTTPDMPIWLRSST
jgi:hypothetical protein